MLFEQGKDHGRCDCNVNLAEIKNCMGNAKINNEHLSHKVEQLSYLLGMGKR